MAALDLLSDVLADTPAGRLHKSLVESEKATGTMGGIWMLREPGVMYYGATVRKEGNLDDVKDSCCA